MQFKIRIRGPKKCEPLLIPNPKKCSKLTIKPRSASTSPILRHCFFYLKYFTHFYFLKTCCLATMKEKALLIRVHMFLL